VSDRGGRAVDLRTARCAGRSDEPRARGRRLSDPRRPARERTERCYRKFPRRSSTHLGATCYVPPLFTVPGWNLHRPAEIGIADFQANRSPTDRYRTAPLRGPWTHAQGGSYHDGRFESLEDVIGHDAGFFRLGLAPREVNDLVEYLKSL
jgi:hypothetical protein